MGSRTAGALVHCAEAYRDISYLSIYPLPVSMCPSHACWNYIHHLSTKRRQDQSIPVSTLLGSPGVVVLLAL